MKYQINWIVQLSFECRDNFDYFPNLRLSNEKYVAFRLTHFELSDVCCVIL